MKIKLKEDFWERVLVVNPKDIKSDEVSVVWNKDLDWLESKIQDEAEERGRDEIAKPIIEIIEVNSDKFGTDYDAITEELLEFLYKKGYLKNKS